MIFVSSLLRFQGHGGGGAHAGSDLDLAIVDYGQENADFIQLKEAIKESNFPFLIDIFELHALPEKLQQEIRNRCAVLYDGRIHGSDDS